MENTTRNKKMVLTKYIEETNYVGLTSAPATMDNINFDTSKIIAKISNHLVG